MNGTIPPDPEKQEMMMYIQTYAVLNQLGEKELADKVLDKIINKIEFVEKEDWYNHQWCGDFPKIDKRCIVFCCAVSKQCPFRAAILKKLGKTNEDYMILKRELVPKVLEVI